MSIVSNILDALRRIGSPSEKSALRRQDQQLHGMNVLERGRVIARHGDEIAPGFHATVEPFPEDVTQLTGAEIEPIHSNAALASSLFEQFNVDSSSDLLDKLDKAFESWLYASDRFGYLDEDIIEILGAAFGNYCNETLGMKWIKVSDQYGVSVAIDGIEFEFRGFPYDSIRKRITDSEHTFFRGIYVALAHQKQRSRRRGDAA